MSQIGNVLKMMILLKSRGKMKIKQLSSALEVDERTIRRYKDDLMQAGIYINSVGGKYGGYYLESYDYLLGMNINTNEYLSLQIAQKHLSDANHPSSTDFKSIAEKINILFKKNSKNIPSVSGELNISGYMVKDTKSLCDTNAERNKMIDIHAAIIFKNKVLLEYNSLTSGNTNRIVRPYALYEYKGDMYIAGFCEKRMMVLDFKLIRICNYKVLEDTFEKDKDFKLEYFMEKCIGIYKDKPLNVKLKIKYPMSQIVSEKIWVENQHITNIGGGEIIYEAQMCGMTEIKCWILGMGSSVTVIEPEEIRHELMTEINKMAKNYS